MGCRLSTSHTHRKTILSLNFLYFIKSHSIIDYSMAKWLLLLLFYGILDSDVVSIDRTIHKIMYQELKNLSWVESRNRNNLISKKGAIGYYQITTNCLSHYNWDMGKQIRPSELFNKQTNEMVAMWYLNHLYNFFDYLPENDKYVAVYSAYNLGQYRAKHQSNQLLIYRPYVAKITPYRYGKFKLKNKLIWKGKNIDLWEIK